MRDVGGVGAFANASGFTEKLDMPGRFSFAVFCGMSLDAVACVVAAAPDDLRVLDPDLSAALGPRTFGGAAT